MAKVIAPFKISGTLDDLNFYLDQDGNNIVRMKGKTGITSEQYKNLPSIHKVRMHGSEFGRCSKKSVVFRALALQFNNKAKEGSFAGRATKLLFEIAKEDQLNALGNRTVANGLATAEGKELLLHFESNKHRPITSVLKGKQKWNCFDNKITISNLNPKTQISWPDDATYVHFSMAIAEWDYENDTFETNYSDEVILNKNDSKKTITLETQTPRPHKIKITFLFIGFAIHNKSKVNYLHRKHNTATIVQVL